MKTYWIYVKRYKFILIITAIFLVVMHCFLFVDAFKGKFISADNASDFGSFIGGYFGSIFALFSTVLLVITLMEQIRSYRIDKFENKFFEMLKLHRENVSEFKLNEYIQGREVFIALIREVKTVFDYMSKYPTIYGTGTQEKHNSLVASYLVLFLGIRSNTTITLKTLLSEYMCVDSFDVISKTLREHSDLYAKKNNKEKYYYTYYDGHQSRLGHYYRHLFQMVDYVDSSFLNLEEKKGYVKLLRAQLSNYEQALFFLNSLTPLGVVWWKKEYMNTYKLVKNIPENFFKDNGIDIDIMTYFKMGYFEWEDYPFNEYTFINGCYTESNKRERRSETHQEKDKKILRETSLQEINMKGMEGYGLRNFKINIVLYKYADKHLQKRFLLRQTYKNWTKYCAVENGKVADEDSIVDFLIHERLLEKNENGIKITPQGRIVLCDRVFITESQKSLFTSMPFWLSLAAFILSVISILASVLK